MQTTTENNEPKAKHALSSNIEDKDLYKTALDTRNLEISMFWQRSNYFLVLNSALALGFFNLKSEHDALLLSAFGLMASYLWLRVTLGSKFWQSRWEYRLMEIERIVAPNVDLFAASWETIYSDVGRSIQGKPAQPWLKRWLERQVMKKYSVSYSMMLLSMLFIGGWLGLGVMRAWRVIMAT